MYSVLMCFIIMNYNIIITITSSFRVYLCHQTICYITNTPLLSHCELIHLRQLPGSQMIKRIQRCVRHLPLNCRILKLLHPGCSELHSISVSLLCQSCERFLAQDGLMWSSFHLHPTTLCLIQSLSHSLLPSRRLPFIPSPSIHVRGTRAPDLNLSVSVLFDYYLSFCHEPPGPWLHSWILQLPTMLPSATSFFITDFFNGRMMVKIPPKMWPQILLRYIVSNSVICILRSVPMW